MNRLPSLIILITLFSAGVFAQADTSANPIPAESKSGGCSLFPDCNYRQCCVEHDKDYYSGGTWKQRLQSDNRLYKCVSKTKGWQNKLIAPVMWMGVRVFGVSFLPTPFRWGFGKTKKKPTKPDWSKETSKAKE